MSKKGTLKQRFRNLCTVYSQKRFFCSMAVFVDGSGKHLFSGTSISLDINTDIRVSHLLGLRYNRTKALAISYQASELDRTHDVLLQVNILALQLFLLNFQNPNTPVQFRGETIDLGLHGVAIHRMPDGITEQISSSRQFDYLKDILGPGQALSSLGCGVDEKDSFGTKARQPLTDEGKKTRSANVPQSRAGDDYTNILPVQELQDFA
jgi:hypothetical protein